MGLHATILTLYPQMFPGPLGFALAGRALEKGLWSYDTIQIRDFARDRHRSVDDTPSGGGAGMVMRADVLARAVDASPPQSPRFLLSPRGYPLNQQRVRQMANLEQITLICGRFEGVDERLIESRNLIEISIGDYILSGGEMAALVLLDSIIRLQPGVMGNEQSGASESFEHGLLEHPHYTRPQFFEGMAIPDILTSGDHGAIARWRQAQAETITRQRRPDLWAAYQLR